MIERGKEASQQLGCKPQREKDASLVERLWMKNKVW